MSQLRTLAAVELLSWQLWPSVRLSLPWASFWVSGRWKAGSLEYPWCIGHSKGHHQCPEHPSRAKGLPLQPEPETYGQAPKSRHVMAEYEVAMGERDPKGAVNTGVQ